MQSLYKAFCHQSLLGLTTTSKRALPLIAQQSYKLNYQPQRSFSQVEVQQQPENKELELEQSRKRIGIDMQFSQQKHAYLLTFPWNFPEIINDFESEYRGLPESNFWHKLVYNTNAKVEFNDLFRQFHQYCAIPDYKGIDFICEGKLAEYVKASLQRIHFHGLDVEMANLTVTQPKMKVLKAEVSYGLTVERKANLSKEHYQLSKKTFFGAKYNYYTPAEDNRSFLDHLDSEYKPYVVAITVLFESPMKMFVQNQNYSAILFGSNDEETVKNVVRFETNMRWLDFGKLLPVSNKHPQGWRITDFNNVLNENPFFEGESF